MLHPTIQTLISRLGELTERGEIPWRPHGANAFRYETEGYLVEVSPEPRFRILDTIEREIDRVDAGLLAAHQDGLWAKRVVDLAGAAQRAATGTTRMKPSRADATPLPPNSKDAPSAGAQTVRKTFGAIDSFVVSRPAAELTPAARPAPNPYKPWS